jgi:glucokinase-like ROK family protein
LRRALDNFYFCVKLFLISLGYKQTNIPLLLPDRAMMVTTADQNLVRKFNTAVVLNTIRRMAPLSRAEVAKFTGLNRSTVSQIINALLNRSLVQETVLQSDRVGRPGLLLELNPSGGFALGIEIGVDFISLVVTDFVANVLWRQRVRSDAHDSQEAILERAYEMTEEGLRQGRALNMRPLGIGLGVPGLVDLRLGELRFAPNLGWRDVPLCRLWSQRFNLPVFVDNEAKAGALGEYYFGTARGVDDFIYLNAGVGLGAGIMIGGKIFRGSHGYASEVGHILMDPQGELCGCGKRGCWETQVGPRAVIRRFRETLRQGVPSTVLHAAEYNPDNITFETIANAALQGDDAALVAMRVVGESLGAGIANLVNVFNPQMVVLGGELNYASEILLPVVRQVVAANAMELEYKDLQVTASAHGRDGCVMGAAALVLDDILHEPNFDERTKRRHV